MNIGVTEFKKLYPKCKTPAKHIVGLDYVLKKYDIDTPRRIAAFLSQCGHESMGFTKFEENLNYSAKALDAIFPKYFKRAGRSALEYHREPEAIANVIYAGRMGNNNRGDGWKFRGRGPIQITGKNNYSKLANSLEMNLLPYPDIILENVTLSVTTAGWYWNTHGLNDYADVSNIKKLTQKINGGYHGLDDRIYRFNRVLKALNAPFEKPDSELYDSEYFEAEGLQRLGSKGELVEMIQRALGIKADGIFGKGTESAVKRWQLANGLVPDGLVGPKTIEKMI